jgi:hypothetical protein
VQKAALPVLDWRLLQAIAYVHESARARARTQVCYVCVCVRAFTEVGYSYHTRICGSETQTANPCSGNANTNTDRSHEYIMGNENRDELGFAV